MTDLSLLERAAMELKSIKRDELVPFPSCCHKLMRSIPGNDRCVDCGSHHPDWASLSYGALICMNCSARHRSLGVQVRQPNRSPSMPFTSAQLTYPKFSKVRSLRLDHWSHDQVLSMLEGGNEQLHNFFARHSMATDSIDGGEILKKRYRTKAAKFYRDGIQKHVETVAGTDVYRGRGASRVLSKERSQMVASPSLSS